MRLNMAEDPVTIVKGGTLAQNILGSAPEGVLIAPAWKRCPRLYA